MQSEEHDETSLKIDCWKITESLSVLDIGLALDKLEKRLDFDIARSSAHNYVISGKVKKQKA